MFLQQLINGLAIGSVYALMAVGYSLIYSLMRFTNFAHGVVVTAAAYMGFYAMTYFVTSVPVGIVCTLIGGAIVSLLIELSTYRPLLLRNALRTYLCIAGLGLSTVFENLIIISLSGRFKSYPNALLDMGSINIGRLTVGKVDLLILSISVIALLALNMYISKSRDGLAIRGASYSLETAEIMGIRTDTLMMKVFIIAGMLAGVAGYFCGIKYTAYPRLGSSLTNKAFVSAVFGGLGSLPGSILGAFLLGIMEVMVSGYISSALRDVFTYSLLVIILLVRPTGLMGKSIDDKA